MNDKIFRAMVSTLTPHTLAGIVVNLEDAEGDWEFYPEEAPPADVRQALQEMLAHLITIGAQQAETQHQDFDQLLEQIRTRQDEDEWQEDRDRQVRQNWLSDLQ